MGNFDEELDWCDVSWEHHGKFVVVQDEVGFYLTCEIDIYDWWRDDDGDEYPMIRLILDNGFTDWPHNYELISFVDSD